MKTVWGKRERENERQMQNRHAQVDLEKEISIVNRFQGDGDLENRDAFVHRLIKEKLLIFSS